MRTIALLRAAALAAVPALMPLAASASDVNVSPTRITLAQDELATNLSLHNAAATPVRFAVHAFTWRQLPDGTPHLEPTDDLIVFPQIVTIAPGAERDIRIAFTGPRAPAERDYRIIATELPAGDDPATRGIEIRTRFSIPVFLAPAEATRDVTAGNAVAGARDVAFDLTENGSQHAFLTSLRARGLDANGATLFDTALPAWYELPGEPRHYVIREAVCGRLARVTLDGTFDTGPPLRTTIVPGRTC